MKVYTSYFGNSRNLNKEGILMIGISRYPPKYFLGTSLFELAPHGYMLKLSPEEYDRLFFKDIIGILNPHDVMRKIALIAKNQGKDNVALCCFEKNPKECHRSYVSTWLNQAGYDVTEFMEEPEPKKPQAIQGSLF